MKQFYFIRHGLTQANIDGILSGRFETDLTAEGKEQVKATALKAKKDGIRFDKIYVSPMGRTLETANIFAEAIGFDKSKMVIEELLLERNFGTLDGTAASDFYNHYTYQDFDIIEGTETVEHMQNRAIEFYNLVLKDKSNVILAVGHGAYGRALRRVFQGKTHLHEYTDPFEQIQNAALHKWL